MIIKVLIFLLLKNVYSKIEQKTIFALMYHIHISKEKFEDCLWLLLINDENEPHYVYIKDFKRFMFNKTKHKKYFV